MAYSECLIRGKTHLLRQLKNEPPDQQVLFYDGSEKIADLAGGLDAFNRRSAEEQRRIRKAAIQSIRDECAATRKVGVVAGHAMLWGGKADLTAGEAVWTGADANTYTKIIYLEPAAGTVARRSEKDKDKRRPKVAPNEIRQRMLEKKAFINLGA